MSIRTTIILLLILFEARAADCQPWYFNQVYNPYTTWAAGHSIYCTEIGYFGCAVSSETDPGFYEACTFTINQSGEMTQWKGFGRYGADFYIGDEGALAKCNNGFGVFGGVEDWLNNDSLYGIFYRFDENGDTLFTRYFSDDNYDVLIGRTCASTSDGGFTLAGDVSVNHGFSDIIIIKIDSSGTEQWRNYLGTELSDWAKSIIQTTDKGFAIGSWSRIPYIGNDTADPIVFKTDSLGTLEWSTNLGGPFLDDHAMLCNSQDSSIIVLTAYADTMSAPGYPYTRTNIVKLNLQGEILWNKKYQNNQTLNNISNIICTENGDFMACGYAEISLYLPIAGWLFRFNSEGDSLWYRYYFYYPESPPVLSQNFLYDVSQSNDNGFVAVGQAYAFSPENPYQEMWVLKVDSVGCEIENCWVGINDDDKTVGRYDGKTGGLEIWPNPASGVIHGRLNMDDGRFYRDLTLIIYDIFGREVEEIIVPDKQREFQINVESYPPAVYIAILKEGFNIVVCRKFVVAR